MPDPKRPEVPGELLAADGDDVIAGLDPAILGQIFSTDDGGPPSENPSPKQLATEAGAQVESPVVVTPNAKVR